MFRKVSPALKQICRSVAFRISMGEKNGTGWCVPHPTHIWHSSVYTNNLYVRQYVRPFVRSFAPFDWLHARRARRARRACVHAHTPPCIQNVICLFIYFLKAMGWLDETPDKEARVLLLVALRDITDGKIFVEAERAKLTRMLAKVRGARKTHAPVACYLFRGPVCLSGRCSGGQTGILRYHGLCPRVCCGVLSVEPGG